MTPNGLSGLGFYVFGLQNNFISNSQNINIVYLIASGGQQIVSMDLYAQNGNRDLSSFCDTV